MFIVIDGACLWMSERTRGSARESAHYVTAVLEKCFRAQLSESDIPTVPLGFG